MTIDNYIELKPNAKEKIDLVREVNRHFRDYIYSFRSNGKPKYHLHRIVGDELK